MTETPEFRARSSESSSGSRVHVLTQIHAAVLCEAKSNRKLLEIDKHYSLELCREKVQVLRLHQGYMFMYIHMAPGFESTLFWRTYNIITLNVNVWVHKYHVSRRVCLDVSSIASPQRRSSVGSESRSSCLARVSQCLAPCTTCSVGIHDIVTAHLAWTGKREDQHSALVPGAGCR